MGMATATRSLISSLSSSSPKSFSSITSQPRSTTRLWCHQQRVRIGLLRASSSFLSSTSISSFKQQERNFSSSSATSTTTKVAIVGSGPSGCYTAKYLQSSFLKKFQSFDDDHQELLSIDIIERLPTPYGLVRNGVAPDHPEVKNVQYDFDKLFVDSTDESSDAIQEEDDHQQNPKGIQFYGNVNVGHDVSLEELRHIYDIVVLAYGCESDRNLPFMNDQSVESSKRVLSARQFVNWYNGHIDYNWVGDFVKNAITDTPTDQQQQTIVVIGHGNVALDCARILAKNYNELNQTDITTQSLKILHDNREEEPQHPKRNIHIVGRRGHIQAAFTIKEIRELTKLGSHAKFIVSPEELEAGKSSEASQKELKDSRPKTRINKLLVSHAAKGEESGSSSESASTIVNLRFLTNPIRFEASGDGGDGDSSRVRVVCERTQLEGEAESQNAIGTGVEEAFDADLVLVSIGYKGLAIPGTEQWYDDRTGIIRNTHGMVDVPSSSSDNSNKLAGLYVSGWLKRGPSGIIGTNIADAKDTVASIIKDYSDTNCPKADDSPMSLLELLRQRQVEVVDWKGYRRIDDAEMDDGRKRHPDQPREKITTKSELLSVASALKSDA